MSSVRLLRWKFLCEDQLTLHVRGDLLCSSLSPLHLVLSEADQMHVCPPPACVCIHWGDPPKPSLLQADRSHPSQPFLTRKMFQFLYHLSVPQLDSLQYVCVFLVLRSPELDRVLQVWPHQCWAQRKVRLPPPAGNSTRCHHPPLPQRHI